MKIQKPTRGRVVEYTAFRGHQEKDTDAYTALVTGVTEDPLFVNLVTFGTHSVYFQTKVPYDADGKAGTWRYPPRCEDMIEVFKYD